MRPSSYSSTISSARYRLSLWVSFKTASSFLTKDSSQNRDNLMRNHRFADGALCLRNLAPSRRSQASIQAIFFALFMISVHVISIQHASTSIPNAVLTIDRFYENSYLPKPPHRLVVQTAEEIEQGGSRVVSRTDNGPPRKRKKEKDEMQASIRNRLRGWGVTLGRDTRAGMVQ